MKICTKCKQVLQDNEQFCNRCGGINFATKPQGHNPNGPKPQGQGQGQRPMPQGQGQRPQGQRPGQRPIPQGQGQGQGQGQRPQMNPNGQRPQGQRPMPQGQNPNGSRPQGQIHNTQNSWEDTPDNPLFDSLEFDAELGTEENTTNKKGKLSEVSEDGSSVKDWLITMISMIIPLYNLLFIYKTIKSADTPDFKKNYMKAFIIYYIVAFIFSIIFTMLFASTILELLV